MHHALVNFTVRGHKFVYHKRIPVEWALSTLLLYIITIQYMYRNVVSASSFPDDRVLIVLLAIIE